MSWPNPQQEQRQEISQYIIQQNADEEMVGLDLGQSSHVKQRKLRSNVWKHFKKYKDNDGKDWARCNLCEKKFDGSSVKGTTHLRNHFKSCQQKRNGGGGGGDHGPAAKSDDLQVNHLDSTKAACIIEVYKEEKEKLCKYFEKLSSRVCLTIDEAKTGFAKYTCLMVWFIDDDWKLKKKIISFKCLEENESGVQYLKDVLLEWGIDNKISSMVKEGHTNKYNMSCNEIENWFSGQASLLFNSRLLCIRSSQYIFSRLNSLILNVKRHIYEGISRICNYARETSHKSENLRNNLLTQVIPTGLDLLLKLRSDDSFALGVLENVLGLKEAFFELENSDPHFKSINFTKEEWGHLRVLYEYYGDFTPVDYLEHWRKYRYQTANMHFPLLCSMYTESLLLAKHKFDLDYERIVGLTEEVDSYWREYNSVLTVAVVFDPRFKMDIVKHWYKKIYNGEYETQLTIFMNYFTNVYNEYAKGTNNFKSCTLGLEETNSSISYKMLDPLGKPCKSSHDPNHVQLLNFELQLYLKDVKFPLIEDFDILEWWRINARYFPTLSRMARDFLSIQIMIDPLSDEQFEISYDLEDLADSVDLHSSMIEEAFICTKRWLAK